MAPNVDPAAITWLDKLLPAVIQLSIFGGSITFTVVVGQYPSPLRFAQEIGTFLALAWLFFVLALGVASAAEMALTFNRDNVVKRVKGEKLVLGGGYWKEIMVRLTCWLIVRFPLSLALQTLVLLAFLFLSLAVAAYHLVVGWIAFALTATMIIVSSCAWIVQVCC